ncbi:hypothetical protein GE061_005687 [Apolygus lucorum]|uniref:Uncharacterized protein n=1 Tax=Apolygus lucorum TaxID=248454 RepID=A0A6A4J1R1_APOLU|nr:hypothetical protein GE061_005687 [Apolygus lucorum]
METLLIFIPRSLSKCQESGRLLGVFSAKNAKTSDAFYVLGFHPSASPHDESIGYLNSTSRSSSEIEENKLFVSCINGEPVVESVVKNHEIFPLSKCHIIQYDEASLVKSELYIPQDGKYEDISGQGDYFKVLAYHLKRQRSAATNGSRRLPVFISRILVVLELLSRALDATKLSTFSSIGVHLKDSVINLKWLLEKIFHDRGVTLQTGNMIFSMVVDIVGGLAVAYVLDYITRDNKSHVFGVMAAKTEELLEFIKYMIKWLMGSPAGLKLNYPLNYILGNFFLYNIYLWWTFLGLIRPLLEVGFNAFLKLGFLGILLQIAILADMFSLVTFHLYCIYIYAARLYEFQIKGILSLSKIFLGRKRNPEPDKVDSCPYSTEQLFVGTVCFTVLLFLLPTTLVYYVVFTLIRLGFICFGGILTRARFLLQILPLYSSVIWTVYPRLLITTTKLVPVCGLTNAGIVTLVAQPEVSSWFDTMSMCVPAILHKPANVNWKSIVENVLSGKLVYPV